MFAAVLGVVEEVGWRRREHAARLRVTHVLRGVVVVRGGGQSGISSRISIGTSGSRRSSTRGPEHPSVVSVHGRGVHPMVVLG